MVIWATFSSTFSISWQFFSFFTGSLLTRVAIFNWSEEILALLASTVWHEYLRGGASWHWACHSVSRNSSISWAWDAVTLEGNEAVSCACNILTTTLVWSLNMSWWALVAFTVLGQVFVWMACLFWAIESSGKSEWWADFTLAWWEELFSSTAVVWCAIEWVGPHSERERWAVLAHTVGKDSLSRVTGVGDAITTWLRDLAFATIWVEFIDDLLAFVLNTSRAIWGWHHA